MTVFISKGDAPMTYRQAVKRGLRYFNAQKADWEREQAIFEEDPAYVTWATQWVADNVVNAANNTFNGQLADYNAAVARLAEFEVSVGRPEIIEILPTGNYVVDEETGEPVIDPQTGDFQVEVAEVVVQSLVEPLPATVEQDVYDEAGEVTGTEEVPNPLIVKDEQERAAAQATIDATPQEVIDFE